VFRQGKALVPSFTAFAVTKLLREHFGDFVEIGLHGRMEEDLDEISRGERESVAFLKQFYFGDKKHRGLPAGGNHGTKKADYPVLDLGVDAETGEPRAHPHRPVRALRAASPKVGLAVLRRSPMMSRRPTCPSTGRSNWCGRKLRVRAHSASIRRPA
jgi:hypothetical protein